MTERKKIYGLFLLINVYIVITLILLFKLVPGWDKNLAYSGLYLATTFLFFLITMIIYRRKFQDRKTSRKILINDINGTLFGPIVYALIFIIIFIKMVVDVYYHNKK